MKKRGISSVIVSIVLVVLVLSALAVVWVVIRGIISQGTQEVGAGIGRFTINLDITDAYESSGNIIVDITRKAGTGELLGIKFIFSDGTDTEVINQDTSLGELDSDTFSVDVNELVSTEVQTVSIAPIFASGSGEETVGNIVDTFEITGEGTGEEEGGGEIPGGGQAVCGDGNCETSKGENAINCPEDCGESVCTKDCGTSVCGPDPVCGQSCGGCSSEQVCDEGQCLQKLILSGTINSLWPIDAARYFDSSQLPTDGSESDLILKYINFPSGSEAGNCIRILRAEYVHDPPVYTKTHLQLERVALLIVGEDYNIWRTDTCS